MIISLGKHLQDYLEKTEALYSCFFTMNPRLGALEFDAESSEQWRTAVNIQYPAIPEYEYCLGSR